MIFYAMADYWITFKLILMWFSGGYWARRLLHNGVRYIATLSIPIELQTRVLQNSMADSWTTVKNIQFDFWRGIRLDISCTPVNGRS